MAVILVEHDTSLPALHGALAAVVAERLGFGLAHLPTRHDLGLYPDAVQHVPGAGPLVTSGLLWYERLTGRALPPPTDVAGLVTAARAGVVVPLGPAVIDGAELERRLAEWGVTVVVRRVVEEDGICRFVADDGSPIGELGRWRRDRYGRPVEAIEEKAPEAPRRRLRIGFVGRPRDQSEAYPATLAALGDAADAAGLVVEPIFVPPHGLDRAGAAKALTEVDGLLLPGGSDMGVVAGQIACAEVALERSIPTLGLCLGMQTLATAAVRRTPEGAGASLAEADPDAPKKTFVPIDPDLGRHRLGDRRLGVAAGSRLAGILGDRLTLRCNHRYRFDTRLEGAARIGGLMIAARESEDDIVDAVEGTGDTFLLGLQGHPELSSRAGDPHPVFTAFLAACRNAPSLNRKIDR